MNSIKKPLVIGKECLESLVRNNHSFSAVLRVMGQSPHSASILKLKDLIAKYGIDCSHFAGSCFAMVQMMKAKKKPLSDFLVEHSTGSRVHIKTRLFEENRLENKCAVCHRDSVWEGKSLVLILDHINGINDDYRIENLRLVCPNCASQLKTHAGKNRNGGKKIEKRCPGCGKLVTRHKTSGWCKKCLPRKKRTPDFIVVKKLVDDIGIQATANEYKCSKNTIYRWIHSLKC